MSDVQTIEVNYETLAGCACALCCAAPDAVPQEQTATGGTQGFDSVATDADQGIDALISGSKWETTSLTFSFPDSPDDYSYDFYNEANTDFGVFNEAQKASVRTALDYFASFSGLEFTELTGEADRDADLMFAESGRPSTAWAYYPSDGDWGGDAWFNRTSYNNPVTGNYAWSTVMHEIGHGLGLKHGHQSGGGGTMPLDQDSHEYSIMTYRSYVGSPGSFYTNATWSGPQTPMIYDIAAIQRMYGANYEFQSDDSVYTFDVATGQMFVNGEGAAVPGGNHVFRAVWDGGGEDTYDFANYTRRLDIDLAPGGHVDLAVGGNQQRALLGGGVYAVGHVFNALEFNNDARSLIENAIGGSNNDLISGNRADNRLEGRGGADTLQGFAGDDTLIGGGGGDVFVFARDGAGDGDADLFTDFSFDDGDALSLTGFAAGLFSGAGASSGGGAFFADTLGDLVSLGEAAGVEISEAAGGGALLSFIDGAWIATVELATIAYQSVTEWVDEAGEEPGPEATVWSGGASGDAYEGEDGADILNGNGGADTLGGGDGADEIFGGWGQDKLNGGAGDDSLFGGGGDDRLDGDGGADLMEGGTGADRLIGRWGQDTLKGGEDEDILLGGGGDDLLLGGGHADTLKGGQGADDLKGGSGRDHINGGAGADAATGGGGGDVFVFAASHDSLTITDFGNGADRIELTGVARFSEVVMWNAGGNAVIALGDGRLTVEGVNVQDLGADDFIF